MVEGRIFDKCHPHQLLQDRTLRVDQEAGHTAGVELAVQPFVEFLNKGFIVQASHATPGTVAAGPHIP